MIEILALVYICKSVGNIARNKGRATVGYQALAVVFWFGFEFLGAVAAVVFATGAEEPGMLFLYAGALAGAAVGALASFAVVMALPSRVDPYAHIPMDAAPVPPLASDPDTELRRAI